MLNLELFQSRLGRTIEVGQLVAVHWNSHEGVWSIIGMKSRNTIGVVLGYASEITLEDCTFKIDKSKKQVVLDKQRKERHAFVVGKIKSLEFVELDKSMYYQPFKLDTFADAEKFFKDGEIVYLESAKEVSMMHNGKPVVKYSL